MKDKDVQRAAVKQRPEYEKHYAELESLLGDLDGFKKYIKIQLHHYHLTNRHAPEDIIDECFSRWHNAVTKGKSIPVPTGWMRITALHRIQELSREEQRTVLYDPAVLVAKLCATSEQITSSDDECQQVRAALEKLPTDKRELLELRFFSGLDKLRSWDEIAGIYNQRGKATNAAALRKQGERAIKALREIYLEMLREQR